MGTENLPDISQLRANLRYDPETGKLYWSEDAYRNRGCEAFTTKHKDGYLRGKVARKSLLAHRVIWAIVHGAWPVDEIDHIDGNPSNNRLGNLREATRLDNNRNRAAHKNNTSGVVGVSWCQREGKWHAQVAGRHIGYFDDLSAAAAARLREQKRHPFHKNHGRKPAKRSTA